MRTDIQNWRPLSLADIDVVILREEQSAAYRHLSQDWRLCQAEKGWPALWEEGEHLSATSSV